jgi:hypothetical protein
LPSSNRGFDEEGHEAQFDIVSLLESLLSPLTHLHDCAHIYIVEGGEHSGRLLRFY